MASSRTKSFFEQDHRPKARPSQWRGQHDNKPVLGEVDANVPPRKPSIPPTSQTKSKLKAFAFAEGQPAERHSKELGKENAPDMGDPMMELSKTVAPAAQLRVEEPARMLGSVASRTPQLSHANTFPSTPGTRLPIADLIGDLDETIRRPEPIEQSPQDQLTWIPNSSSELLTPNLRKRKRARSSSPSCPTTSSQRQTTSTFITGTSAAQIESITPEADPTADLWQRYAAGKPGVDGLRLPNLNTLLLQASPRPLETPVKNGGLRRWASTGNDWPSTKGKSKRPRLNPSTNSSLLHEQQQNSVSGKSKLAAMVEKIQESLASQKLARSTTYSPTHAEAAASSDPLRETAVELSGNPSPLQARPQPQVTEQPIQAPLSIVPCPKPYQHDPPSVSLYASPDVDHQDRPFQDPVLLAPLQLHSKAPLPAFKRPSISRTSSGGGRIYPTAQPAPPPPPLPVVTENVDDFGDEFEFSAEDLEELVSQAPLHTRSLYDIPPHPNPPLLAEDVIKPRKTVISEVEISNEFGLSDDDDDDEFGCGDIDEDSFAQAEVGAAQAYKMPSHEQDPRKLHSPRKSASSRSASLQYAAPQGSGLLQRYKVEQVIDSEYTNAKGRRCPEKLLMVEDERTSKPTAIMLRDSWLDTCVAAPNIVHVAHVRRLSCDSAPPSSPPGQITIADGEGSPLLVVHPDHMLSATTVADSFDCLRKAVLQDRIKATGENSKPMVYGKILHEIFQQALSANRWDEDYLSELIERTMQCHVEGLWELGMRDTVLAVEEVKAKLGEVTAWAKVFVAPEPSTDSIVDDKQGEQVWMSISKLVAIEEHIWSPRFGLKGNIDATVQSTLVDHPDQPYKRLIAPFEIKTGRTTQSAAHRAQTALYTLLMSDRYNVAVEAGILYYLESSTMSRIAPPVNELRQMIQQRNRLASYIHQARNPRTADQDVNHSEAAGPSQEIEESGLPVLLKNPFKCGRCYAQQSCFTYHALVEGGTADSAGFIDDTKKNHSLIWHEAVGHLALTTSSSSQAVTMTQWFTKWDKLLTFEESDQSRYRKDLWTMTSAEREATGRCFGDLVLAQDLSAISVAAQTTLVDGVEGSGGKINRYTYVFARSARKAGHSFADGSQLTFGEPIVVSSEHGQWALANGYVIATSKHDITVAVDRKLGVARRRLDGFDESRNQVFQGSMTMGSEDDESSTPAQTMLYRLDKDEFSNGLALIRNNLVMLMAPHPIYTKLRDLLINGNAPAFTSSSAPLLPPTQLGQMNEDQRGAVNKVMSAQDYALILGMPGTGKTTTIAHIIRALLAENKTILLTSFTHTAVDNILLKIRDIAPPNSILRLGVPAKINHEVQTFCRLAATPWKTIDEIEEVYMGCQIVATTCMGTNHAVFRRRAFDVCIVDEASQITLPTSLGPLLHARKFVLVGDHYQLPPLVQNRAALAGGLDVSLFRQLSEQHPEAVATLGEQYRMCEDVMTLSNELIYDGKLRCGNVTVAGKSLQLSNEIGLKVYHSDGTGINGHCSLSKLQRGQCWLAELSRPSRKVVFANTDPCGALANEVLTSGNRITNHLEATLSAQIVLSLLALGVPGREIGVITLYRSQLSLLRQIFKLAGIPSDVEIDSADRFQGRDKECIVLSMVRSNDIGVVGELLKDWRRVNVALTRAKTKLIILGSRRTLCNTELLASFLALVDERQWAVELPRDADTAHTFDFSSQTPCSHQSPGRSDISMKQRSLTKRASPGTFAKDGRPASVAGVLSPSPSKGNQGRRVPRKVVKGQKTMVSSGRARQMKEQLAMEIWEDLTAEDL